MSFTAMVLLKAALTAIIWVIGCIFYFSATAKPVASPYIEIAFIPPALVILSIYVYYLVYVW